MTSSRRSRARKSSAKRYVIWHPENRWGAFEFCCSTQANYCKSLRAAQQELKDMDFDWEGDEGEFGYDRHPNEYHIYQISLTRVKE